MKENRVNLLGLFNLVMYSMLFGILGLGLPKTINFINGFKESSLYGHFASYVVLIILFFIFFKDTKLIKKRESYFIYLEKIVDNVNIAIEKRKMRKFIKSSYKKNAKRSKKE